MRKRLTYANVVATLALVFAMSGGALAASHYLINSTKQINPKVLRKLKGGTGQTGPTGPSGKIGAQGPVGSQGAPGPEGKTGPSEAISSQATTAPFPGNANAADAVGTVSLGPGSYTLQATVTANNEAASADNAQCILYTGGKEQFGEAEVTVGAKARGDMALSGFFVSSSTVEMKLACMSSSTQGDYVAPTLTATKVGAVHVPAP